MKKAYLLLFCALLALSATASAKEARLIRYPNYNQGRVTFSYLGDIWVADEDGQNIQRLTVNKARDVYPRFSPDGKWIAFSSDRNGNLDVFLIPSEGGTAKPLTFHSADDTVLGWTPDSRAVLFSSNRGEDFMPRLYTVSVEGGLPRPAGPDMGLYACYSPDGDRGPGPDCGRETGGSHPEPRLQLAGRILWSRAHRAADRLLHPRREPHRPP